MPTLKIELDNPHAGQLKVIGEAGRFNVLECGRRFGKTTLGINLAVEAALAGGPVGWFAPTYKLLSEVWREIVAILTPARAVISQQEKRLALPTGGTIECWSLDQPDAGRGRKYKRAIIDEAGIVRELEVAWQQAIRPTLTDYKGDAWFLGTPKGQSNYFHRLFGKGQRGDGGWRSWRLPTTTNPAIDPAEIEAARQDMPEAAFNQEFLGIPSADGGNPFGVEKIVQATRDGLSDLPVACWGVDLAKSFDWTVACGLDAHGGVAHLERWQGDWGLTRTRLIHLIGDAPALVDSTGAGDPIFEDLYRAMPNAEGFKFSQNSKQQIMEGLAAAFHRGEVTIPAGWLVAECESFGFEYHKGGAVRYSAPQGLHDDGVCALALGRHKLTAINAGWVDVVSDVVRAVG